MPECYDYIGSVLFNAHAPELWRRFTITLRRTLARQAGLTGKAFAAQARLSYPRSPGTSGAEPTSNTGTAPLALADVARALLLRGGRILPGARPVRAGSRLALGYRPEWP